MAGTAQAKVACCYKKAVYGTVYALQAAVGAPYASNTEAKLVAGLEPLVALALTTAVACIGVYLAFSLYWCDCHRHSHPSQRVKLSTVAAVSSGNDITSARRQKRSGSPRHAVRRPPCELRLGDRKHSPTAAFCHSTRTHPSLASSAQPHESGG